MRSKQLAAFDNGNDTVITPNGINLDTYHELSRFLKKAIVIKQCTSDEFDSLITKVFSSENDSGILSKNSAMNLILRVLQTPSHQLKIY